MAKNKNNTTLYIVLAIAAVFLFNNGFTGNYVSNYHSISDSSMLGCPQEGQQQCEFDPNTGGFWAEVCEQGRWSKKEFCGSEDNSCGMKRQDYRTFTAECENPRVGKEGSPDYRSTTY